MLVKDILEQKTSVILGARGYTKQANNISLRRVLFDLSDMWKDYICEAREILKTQDRDKYKEFKNRFPVWFPSGCIANGSSADKDMTSHTNVLALDIDVKRDGDHKENETIDIEQLRQQLMKEPYVFAVLKSLSGEGLYVLILVEDWKYTKGYYLYLVGVMKRKYNIDLDKHASNIARKRFISWEEDLDKWIKSDNTDIKPWKLYVDEDDSWEIDKPQKIQRFISRHPKKYTEASALERTEMAIWALLNSGYTTNDYGYWYRVGCDFAALKDGEAMFEKLTDNYTGPKIEKDKINTWKSCMKSPTTIDKDFHRKWQGLARCILGIDWWKKQ